MIGEPPYSEKQGDRDELNLEQEDIETINRVRNQGVPVVVILLSGRPLIIEPEIKNWDALIAAWLPGAEAQGIADVLFGDYKPSGKLPHTWPR